MQSIFRLAWCTDPAGERKPEKAILPRMRSTPVVEIPIFSKLKRKRSESPEPALPTNNEISKRRKVVDAERPRMLLPETRQADAQPGARIEKDARDVERSKSVSVNLISPVPHPSCSESTPYSSSGVGGRNSKPSTGSVGFSIGDSDTNPTAAPAQDLKRSGMRQVIENQFNLEILLKHRELRLIEQELAKCQTALEQLRRCELIPFPGATGLSENLSAGTGPALKAQPNNTIPEAPAAWGVTDGPYSRHYARWLLNDPTFDSIPLHQVLNASDAAPTGMEGRSTRNSNAGLGKAGKGRTARDSVGNLNQALPNYTMQPRGKGGPLVIKRMADNQFVKLICNNCQRGDFSSVQGFLNHCRIAHKVDYKSHEAAAADCGRLLEEHESHLIPQGVPPISATSKTSAPKPPTPVSYPSTAFVHPLNAAVMPRNTWKIHSTARSSMNASQTPKSEQKTKASPAAAAFHSNPLVTSALTPYLSAQFAKRGFGGNLQHATSQAREKIDCGPDLAEDDERSMPPRKNSIAQRDSSNYLERPQSRKGARQPLSRPRPAPLAPTFSSAHRSGEIPESPQDMNLSPHTADSNPGLVSDHEDDDVASDLDEARSDRHHSPAPAAVTNLGGMRGATCGSEAMEVDLEIEDDMDGHGVLIRPKSLAYQELRRGAGSPSRPVSRFGEAAK